MAEMRFQREYSNYQALPEKNTIDQAKFSQDELLTAIT